jgi:hypothetical protein
VSSGHTARPSIWMINHQRKTAMGSDIVSQLIR